MRSRRGSAGLPRYWATLGKEVIFDYSKHSAPGDLYPYKNDVSEISGRESAAVER